MSYDDTYPTLEELRLQPYDPAHRPLPIPITQPFDNPTAGLCLNVAWWPYVAGMVDRLRYSDAWLGTDEEKQAAIQNIIEILDAIGQLENCMDIPLMTDCCGQIINYNQQFQIYNSYTYNNQSWYDASVGDIIINNQTINEAGGVNEIIELAGDKLITNGMICQAAHLFLYWLHDIGEAEKQGKISHNPELNEFTRQMDTARNILYGIGLVAAVIPGGQGIAVTVGWWGTVASIADDAVKLAAAVATSDFTKEELEAFACILYSTMKDKTAGYTAFQGIDFGNTAMNNIWADIATIELYAAWLAMLKDPTLETDFNCCEDCDEYWPGIQQIITGKMADLNPLWAVTADFEAGSVNNKRVEVRVNFPEPRKIRAASVWAIGKRYTNSGIDLDYRFDTDAHTSTVMVNQDQSAIEYAQLNELTEYFAPDSHVLGAQPYSNWCSFRIDFASCGSCNATQQALYDAAYGVMFRIRICWEI